MKPQPLRASVAVAIVGMLGLGVTVVGCGDERPERVPVLGTVLIDGAPLTHGAIMFVNSGTRPAGSAIDSDGHFALNCYTLGDGAVLGRHLVKVTGSEPIDDHSCRWHAPKKYADENTSGIEVEITEPVDDLKIELTWDGGKPFVERW